MKAGSWQAERDGGPAELARANYLFLAVKLPAGRHQVTIQYSPLSLKVGLLLQFLTLAFFAWTTYKRAKKLKRED